MIRKSNGKRFFWGSFCMLLCGIVTFGLVSLHFFPEHLFVYDAKETMILNGPFSARLSWEEDIVSVAASGDAPVTDNIDIVSAEEYSDYMSATMTLDLFGMPLRHISVQVLRDREVVPVGMTVEIIIDTTGLMVLGTGSVIDRNGNSVRPCENSVKSGDLLLKINDVEIKNHKQFITYLDGLPKGSEVELTLKRGAQTIAVKVKCAVSAEDGKNRLGLWIRDSTKGIGTITYYSKENNRFAALGHGVVDVDTKQLIPVKEGRLYQTEIVAVKKGGKGVPGELVGEVRRDRGIGLITDNTNVGLFGTVSGEFGGLPMDKVSIALQEDVREGPAVILSNVNGKEIKRYDIFIEKVNRYAADDSKGMIIRITDQELITYTNGIVQGMSGCPIIQNGRLVGAVTHVFVQNPLRGYGIFIENMMKHEKS